MPVTDFALSRKVTFEQIYRIWFCRSHKVRLPGTEDMDKEYRDHLFHLRGFFKGCAIGAVISAMSAGLIVAGSALFM